ncbi:MAG: proprotein convertase P-domain-containing protein [Flavobacteriales bacterium]|nr:proprotein convertase P-domain-containing protein [Flavobacteriales bacterium]
MSTQRISTLLVAGLLAVAAMAQPDTWTQRSSLGEVPPSGPLARIGAATFTVGGKAYLCEGLNNGTIIEDFWEYDPATLTWSQKADFPGTPRAYGVGFSTNDHGYVATGITYGNIRLNDTWRYDPATNSWAQRANVPGQTRDQAFVVSINGVAHVGGGIGGDTFLQSDLYAYDAATDTWTARAPLPGNSGRQGPAGFASGGKGYMVGGFDGLVRTNAAFAYDPATNIWTQVASIPALGRRAGVGFSLNDQGYTATGLAQGGDILADLWRYEVATNTWTALPSRPGLGRYLSAAFVAGGEAYVGFGFGADPLLGNTYLTDMARYNAVANAWSPAPGAPDDRRDLGAGFALDGKGYVFGGRGGDFLNDLWSYDPATDQWSQRADLPAEGRTSPVAFAIGGTGYVATGFTRNSGRVSDLWAYDPGTNSWSARAPMPTAGRNGALALVVGGTAFVGTGFTGTVRLNDLWAYDPLADSWTPRAELPGIARNQAAGFELGGQVYLGTGFDGVNALNDLWAYDPATDTWDPKAALPGVGRRLASGFALVSRGIMAGGTAATTLSETWSYDPFADAWTQRASLPGGPRTATPTFVIDDHGYLATGFGPFGLDDEVWSYQSIVVNDCNGVPNGGAFLDACGQCVGGDTGEEPCVADCAGVQGGSAYLDECDQCVGGTTGLEPCTPPCGAAYSFSGDGFVIPDNVPAGISSSIVVTDEGALTDITVTLSGLGHTWAGDLIATITHEASGTTRPLFNRVGRVVTGFGLSADFGGSYAFNDAHTANLWNVVGSPIPGGDYFATGADASTQVFLLDGLAGVDIAGTWTLNISDNAGGDTGSLIGWNLGLSVGCLPDCAGEPGGEAYLDDCGNCVGGNTGNEPCVADCNGVFGGSAFVDECGTCVGGDTGQVPCVQDCNNEFGGTAYLDACGICVGGSTGIDPCVLDCAGVQNGTAYFDECGICVGGDTGLDPCVPPCLVVNAYQGNGFIIPDNVPAGIASSIVVTDQGALSNITVTLTGLGHTWAGDLIATITHQPSGITRPLFNRVGRVATGFGLSADFSGSYAFNDAHTANLWNAVGSPIPGGDYFATGADAPTQVFLLDGLAGVDIAGTWTLNISDNAGGDTGSLQAWTLELTAECQLDCHGDLNGTAYVDACGICVGGDTGLEPCVIDCAGVQDGTAYIDDCGNCVGGDTGVEPCCLENYSFQGDGFIIPDNDPAGLSSSIVVTDAGALSDITVTLTGLGHTWAGDLIATITHEASGTTRPLFNRVGRVVTGFGLSADFGGNYAFNDAHTANLWTVGGTPIPGGNYFATGADAPTQVFLLDGLAGVDIAGTWTLNISDNAGGDTGSLLSWSLGLTADCPVDCNGVTNGTAYVDGCGNCVGGDTGNEPCVADCNGVFGGTAYLDDCGACIGGNTGISFISADAWVIDGDCDAGVFSIQVAISEPGGPLAGLQVQLLVDDVVTETVDANNFFAFSDIPVNTNVTITVNNLITGVCEVVLGPFTFACATCDIPFDANAGNDAMVFFGNYNPQSCVTLQGTATGGAPFPGGEYLFQWGNGPVVQGTSLPLQVCPTTDTVYLLTVTDAAGCVTTDEVTVLAVNINCSGPGNNNKVRVCINGVNVCISINAVAAVLANNPNATLGPCPKSLGAALPGVGLFPNPTDGALVMLSIDDVPAGVDQITVEVFDLAGQRQHSWIFATQGERFISQLDLRNDLASGVYFVQVGMDGHVVTERLVIAR